MKRTAFVLLLLIALGVHSPAYSQGTVINGDRSIVGSLCVGSSGTPVDRLSLCAAPVASATRALLNLSNTAISGGSAAGTYIGANPAACTGNFWDFQLAGAARSVLSCAGALTIVSSTNNLSVFAATTSAQLAGVLSDETGTAGFAVFSVSPTLTTPTIGAATATSITIGANLLNTSEWANLDGSDQAVATTSSPQFNAIGLGTAAAAANRLNSSAAPGGGIRQDWSGAGTGVDYGQIANTGGTVLWGVERSTGGGVFVGTSAYSGVIGTATNTDFHLAANNTVVLTLSGTATAVVGTFKSTAESLGWVVQNAANQICTTTCTTGACVVGIDTVTTTFLACNDATADSCLCAG